MKRIFLLLLLIPVFIFAEPMYSPTWGFFIDLPEGYEYIDGDGKDRFSFAGPGEAMFDIVVYYGVYGNINELVSDVNRRIGNRGDTDFFDYYGRQAALIELDFGYESGWGLCVELSPESGITPMLLALAYDSAGIEDMALLHISALDSISPSFAERKYPGPIMEYGYPRGGIVPVTIIGGLNAMIYENDAEGSQVLIEREFQIFKMYANTQYWQEAWIRYYRFIYRDSWDRVTNAAYALVNNFGGNNLTDEGKRVFAQKTLEYVQNSFEYERDLSGSDFFNLVTLLTEGYGSCDSYSMLWAIILAHADIRSGMMVSGYYAHAMGLADIEGLGARFDAHGTRWLVAETTDKVDIGLIAQDVSDPDYWFAVIFE